MYLPTRETRYTKQDYISTTRMGYYRTFLGLMMRLHRVQRIPVHIKAKLLCADICSAGIVNCENVTHANPHFITGAYTSVNVQQWVYPVELADYQEFGVAGGSNEGDTLKLDSSGLRLTEMYSLWSDFGIP